MIHTLNYPDDATRKQIEKMLNEIYYSRVPKGSHPSSFAPLGWRPKMAVEDCVRVFGETIEYTEFRQITATQTQPNNTFSALNVQLFYTTFQMGWGITNQGTLYIFGCDHTFQAMGEEERRARGYHRFDSHDHWSFCTKCGFVHGSNSSG